MDQDTAADEATQTQRRLHEMLRDEPPRQRHYDSDRRRQGLCGFLIALVQGA